MARTEKVGKLLIDYGYRKNKVIERKESNDEEEFVDPYFMPQCLGLSDSTRSSIRAMAAILTSIFQQKKITAVIGQFRGSDAERILFLVWDWFYPGITIIQDGFGTHHGEGGTGLSAVLGLIKFYNIPLWQVWIGEKQAFRELADGTLTEAMFDRVQIALPYDWQFHPLAIVQKVRRGKQHVLVVTRGTGHKLMEIPLP